MKMEPKQQETRQLILNNLSEKSGMKQVVYDNTFASFNLIKEVLHEMATDYNSAFKGIDKRVKLEYHDRGKFEAEIRVAGDILIFSMHSNVFQFDRDHNIWKLSYVKDNPNASYCGIINIYNFLRDSFKYNRLDDLGYLIGRIFINKDYHYFVEGKRQMGFLYNNFGTATVDKDSLVNIIQSSILYTLEFDLLVPPYDVIKIASVNQMNTKIENSKLQTGKRLGFKFNSDDVLEDKQM